MNKPAMKARRYWRPHEEEIVRDLYENTPTEDIARRLRFSVQRVYQKAWALGLHKSQSFLKEYGQRLNGHDGKGTEHRFQRGGTPWNKGRKGMPPLSPNTVFKRGARFGQALQNWVPIGSMRVSSDGYLVVKVADAINVPQNKNWRAMHRVVWEQAHGSVPKGHAIVFKDGRRTTDPQHITLDALEIITRAELMRRNSVQRWPEELRRLAQLRGVLSRVINQRAENCATTEEELTP